MEIRALTNDFRPLLVMDSALELEYSECFQDAGKISVKIPFDLKKLRALATGYRLIVDDLVFTIERVVVQNGTILVTGVGIFAEFKHLYVTNPRVSYATPNSYAQELATGLSLNGVAYSVYGVSGTYDTIEVYDYATSYFDILKRLFVEYDLGYKMFYNADRDELQFYLLAKVDKAYTTATRVIVSDVREDYELIKLELDESNYKNCIDFVQWFPVTQTIISKSYDRSAGESKRALCVPMSVPAETEGELYLAFQARASELFASHKRKHAFTIRPTRELSISLGDICRLESIELEQGAGALFSERRVRISGTGCDEEYLLEVDYE